VSLSGDSRYPVGFHEKGMCFLKQKVVGCGFFFEHQPDLSGCLTDRGLLYECVCAMPSFSSRRLDLLEACFRHVSARPPFGQLLDLP
jgi:hypothetical protein